MAKKILVVDDEPVIVENLEANLKERGYEVLTAGNGKAGLKEAQSKAPDLILLDVNMPKMDGFKVLEELKKNKKTRDIPVIMLTAEKTQDDIIRGIQGNAEKYLTKPFQTEQVLKEVEKSLALRL